MKGDISAEEFEAKMTAEARRLKRAANGREMLKAIGWVYRNQARQQDGSNVLKNLWSRFRDQSQLMKTRAQTMGTVMVASTKLMASDLYDDSPGAAAARAMK